MRSELCLRLSWWPQHNSSLPLTRQSVSKLATSRQRSTLEARPSKFYLTAGGVMRTSTVPHLTWALPQCWGPNVLNGLLNQWFSMLDPSHNDITSGDYCSLGAQPRNKNRNKTEKIKYWYKTSNYPFSAFSILLSSPARRQGERWGMIGIFSNIDRWYRLGLGWAGQLPTLSELCFIYFPPGRSEETLCIKWSGDWTGPW